MLISARNGHSFRIIPSKNFFSWMVLQKVNKNPIALFIWFINKQTRKQQHCGPKSLKRWIILDFLPVSFYSISQLNYCCLKMSIMKYTKYFEMSAYEKISLNLHAPAEKWIFRENSIFKPENREPYMKLINIIVYTSATNGLKILIIICLLYQIQKFCSG